MVLETAILPALISLFDLIEKYCDNDYFVCGVFTDLQKAFDIVNNEFLLVKLDFHGIRGQASGWIRPVEMKKILGGWEFIKKCWPTCLAD